MFLAAFLEVSNDYYNATGHLVFFAKYNWLNKVLQVLNTAAALMTPPTPPTAPSFPRHTRAPV